MKTLRKTAVLLGFAAFVGLWCVQPADNGADSPKDSDDRTGPRILCHPSAQAIDLGTTNAAVFEVLAESEIPLREDSLTYQWEWSRALGGDKEDWITQRSLTVMTNRVLVLQNVSTCDVAFYRVRIQEETNVVISAPASLVVYYQSESVTAFGPPSFTSKSTGTDCPGAYAGYVTFLKNPGWGWIASNAGPWQVQDRGATKGSNSIEALQYSTWRRQCAPFGETRLTFPLANPPTAGTLWRFAVYFPRDALPPPEPYQIFLKGFD